MKRSWFYRQMSFTLFGGEELRPWVVTAGLVVSSRR